MVPERQGDLTCMVRAAIFRIDEGLTVDRSPARSGWVAQHAAAFCASLARAPLLSTGRSDSLSHPAGHARDCPESGARWRWNSRL